MQQTWQLSPHLNPLPEERSLGATPNPRSLDCEAVSKVSKIHELTSDAQISVSIGVWFQSQYVLTA